eukprot:8961341-Ditylum_brightwellii.AAC.1
MGFLREGIASKAIPQPQLLIKDHKEPEANSEYPTHLVIPVTNFTATFSKVGFMAIQKVLDKNNANYNRFTIVQSLDLKEKLEKLGLTKDDVILMSLDINNMYPLVRAKLIKKALEFYSQNLSEEDKQKIKLGMEVAHFGMKRTLVSFQDKYFVYKGAAKGANLINEDVALAIGVYKSAFLANLVALYLFEMAGSKFIEAKYKGIYKEDGLTVLVGKWNK